MLYYLVVTLYVIVCLLLMVTILLQQGKGGDIANAFGGGSSQAVFGARSGATLLTRATSVLAGLFVILAMVLVVWGQRGPGSVVGGIGAAPRSGGCVGARTRERPGQHGANARDDDASSHPAEDTVAGDDRAGDLQRTRDCPDRGGARP